MLIPAASTMSINATELSDFQCGATGALSANEDGIPEGATVIESVSDYYKIAGNGIESNNNILLKSSNTLPESVDNSQTRYFPEIDSQGSIGSCVSWAQVYYQFTYTMNKSMGVTTTSENTFSPKWTHNFANNGKSDGSWDDDVYELMIEVGNAPLSMVPYDSDYLSWSPEEEIWKTAMKYRLADYQYFKDIGQSSAQITSADDSDLTLVKTALANGDVLAFTSYINAWKRTKLTSNSAVPENDKYEDEYVVVRRSGGGGGHRMTIVGYNDNIWTDINENGNVDSGEMGALKVANSWGKNYCNDGFIWIAYDALNTVSSVSGAPEDSKRQYFLQDITRIDVLPYNSDANIYLRYTLNTSDRSQGKIYATATKDGEEYTYEIGPKRKLGMYESTYSYDGTTNSNDGTMVYALSNVVPGLTSENLHEYTWTLTFEDTNSDGKAFTVKEVEIVDEYTGRVSSPDNVFPFTLDGSKKTVEFPQLEANSSVIYYRGYENPTVHYKIGDGSWNSSQMTENTSVRGYTHKYSIDVSDNRNVTLWFSDENGNVDDNNGAYYTTNSYVSYFATENARDALSLSISDNTNGSAEAEKTYILNAEAMGGYEPYMYQYTYENLNTGEKTETEYTYSATDEISFSEASNYRVTVTVKDFSDETVTASKNIIVTDNAFEFTEFSVNPDSKIRVGKKLDFSAVTDYEHIKSGSNQYNEYEITIKMAEEVCYNVTVISTSSDVSNMTSTINLSWAPIKSGDYTAIIASTDAYGEYAEKTLSFTVRDNVIGDVNRDTYITIYDATQIQKYLSEMIAISEIWEIAADSNKDGQISIKDVTYIQKFISDISDSANVGDIIEVAPDEVNPPSTAPTVVPTTVSKNYIYYKNTNNWSTVKAYYWSTSNTSMTSWPGVTMTSVGDNVYRIEVPSEAQYIIFNNGSAQTGDITLQGMNKIYNNGVWSDYSITDNTDPTDATDAVEKNYLYYYNSSGWSTVKAYYWSDSNTTMTTWPGVAMTSMGDNVYRIEVPSEATKIIFNNGSSQTGDITIQGMNMIYKNGSWSVYT